MEKKIYSTPQLIVHGSIEDITRMPAGGKTPGGGDGKGDQPYGKVPGIADSQDQHSRS